MSNPFSLALTLYSSSADYTYPPPSNIQHPKMA